MAIIGIDLGTSNSAAAVLRGGRTQPDAVSRKASPGTRASAVDRRMARERSSMSTVEAAVVKLPVTPARLTPTRERSLESALRERRSVRAYSPEAVTRGELARLLWAAQGITGPDGLRTAPSAGALYPLEVLVVAGWVDGLASGIYRYEAERQELVLVQEGDRRRELRAAALGQECVETGPAAIALAAVYARTTGKYGKRGIRYVHMEIGHAAQNVWLEATALGLGTVVVGAFDDGAIKRILGLARDEEPLCLMPVGRLLSSGAPRR